MENNNGFVQIIVIIILVIVVISLLGISLQEIFAKLSANPTVGENFKYVTDWIKDVYNKYLARPVGSVFIFIKNYLISIFSNIKIPPTAPSITPTTTTNTQIQQ